MPWFCIIFFYYCVILDMQKPNIYTTANFYEIFWAASRIVIFRKLASKIFRKLALKSLFESFSFSAYSE